MKLMPQRDFLSRARRETSRRITLSAVYSVWRGSNGERTQNRNNVRKVAILLRNGRLKYGQLAGGLASILQGLHVRFAPPGCARVVGLHAELERNAI